MKHNRLFLTLLLGCFLSIFMLTEGKAQDVTLTTQAQVDAFNYSEVTGNLEIVSSSDITNLNALSSLTTIGGHFYIQTNSALTNLDGLSSLTSVGEGLYIETPALTNLNGLSNLTSVGGYLDLTNNTSLTNVDGLSGITSHSGNLILSTNTALTNLNGLSNLTSVGGYFYILYNGSLTNVDGLSNLIAVGGDLWITWATPLTNLDGLSSLTSVGGSLQIDFNSSLSDYCGLYTLLNGGGLVGGYYVKNNAANPTEQEIIDGGACTPPTGTIIIKKITDPASTGVDFYFSSPHFLTVNTPAGIAGTYQAAGAIFGPLLSQTGITGNLELVNDGFSDPNPPDGTITDGCETPFIGFTPGNIAVIDRGLCAFVLKAQNAEAAGASAVIVVNHQGAGAGFTMGGSDPGITIPSIMISYEDGETIKAQLTSPGVNATLHSDGLGVFSLEHGQMKTFNNLPAGTFTVAEEDPFIELPLGYMLKSINIVDPSGGSSGDVGTRLATIDLAPGEIVEVTFTNEPCKLDPPTDTKPRNTAHSVKIDLSAQNPDIPVTFTVVSGPNTGETAIDVLTDVNGIAEFTYIGDGGPGTDNIEANVLYDLFICTAEVTWEQQFPFMTIWAVNDHTDGKLQYYTLDVAVPFLNIEGDILGIDGPKDLEDLIIDSPPPFLSPLTNNGGTIYIVNNVGTSTIYSLDYNEFDNNPATPVTATLVGSTGLPTTPNGSSPEEISSLLIYDGTLYGLSKRSKKLYTISKVDGSVTEVFTLSVGGAFRTDAMTFRPDDNDNGASGPTGVGTVYLVKTDDTGGESEIWKFTSFPSGDIEYVLTITSSGKVEALSAHPDGFLYASDLTTLYKISVPPATPFIGYLADYTVDIEGMDYFYNIEANMNTAPTRAFIPVAPTPVELVSFTAEAKSGKVMLNWETATEVNNYGFEIHRRVTDEEWITLGFVDGHGNSNSPKVYQYADSNPAGGSKFSYRLKQIDNDGTYEYSDIVEVEFVPTEYALYQNYPNPFNPATNIKYNLPQETAVTIKVFDILGEEVMTVVNEKQEAGSYEVTVDGSNLGSGIYFYHMQAEAFSNTKKMLLMK